MRNSKKTAGRIIRNIFLVLFSLGFLFGTYKSYSVIRMNKSAAEAYTQLRISTAGAVNTDGTAGSVIREEYADDILPAAEKLSGDSTEMRQRLINFTVLKNITPEIAAWIKGTGTGIDYPVMRSDDNDFYLTHLFDGSSNVNGAIFIDSDNPNPFYDGNTVIYGHNMKNGAMFNSLNEYKSQDFYDAWPTMMLYTPEEDYIVELICGTIEDGDYTFVRYNFDSDEDMQNYVNNLKARSTFKSTVNLQPGDRLLSMCTCTYERNNARYMLVGRLTPIPEA